MKKLMMILTIAFSTSVLANVDDGLRACKMQKKICIETYKTFSDFYDFEYRRKSKRSCKANYYTCKAAVHAANGGEKEAIKSCKDIRKACKNTYKAYSNVLDISYRNRSRKACRLAETTCLSVVEATFNL